MVPMIIDKCPHCNTRHVSTEVHFDEICDPKDIAISWRVVHCSNPKCHRLVLVKRHRSGEVLEIYPPGSYELEENIEVSNGIREDFKEAGLCLAAGCLKASSVMSRRALHRILKEQGCTQYPLKNAIDYAIKQNILRRAFHKVANEIREYGNLGAHPYGDEIKDVDPLAIVNKESAEQILGFVRVLIQEFYELSEQAAKLEKARQSPTTQSEG